MNLLIQYPLRCTLKLIVRSYSSLQEPTCGSVSFAALLSNSLVADTDTEFINKSLSTQIMMCFRSVLQSKMQL